VVAARLRNKRYCVLADRTIRGAPSQWARAGVNAYSEFKADTIVAETNYGGAMVMHTPQDRRSGRAGQDRHRHTRQGGAHGAYLDALRKTTAG
jgi:phage terminase large subunit-like protein